jgi:hypothetical protein
MKPNFALSLSFDGIRLLRRAAGGWRLVGEVAPDAEDLAAELATLRKTAAALEPGGVRTKLLLPNAQIKYLTLESPGQSEEARRAAAAAALDGATPYAVSELVFDISAEGERTHVAAVARETLEEAEAFATEHRFHPVSFAAVPGDQPFLGEPYFGQAEGAAELLEGETVEPDGVAVVVIGALEVPEGPVAAEAAAPEAPEAAPKAPEAPKAEETPAVALKKPAKGDVTLTPPPFRAAEPAPARTAPSLGGARREAKEEAPAAPATPPTTFASRRGGSAPRAPERREPSLSAPAAPAPPEERPALQEELTPSPAPEAPAPEALDKKKPDAEGKPALGFLSRRRSKAARSARAQGEAPMARPLPGPRPDPARDEAERMTIFGARRGDVGGKPRFLGLMLTVALLVFLAGVAAWAAVFLDEEVSLSRLFGERAEPEVSFANPPPAPEPAPLPEEAIETELEAEPEPEPEAEAPPLRTAALEPELTEEDSAVLDALRAPVAPPAPEELSQAELEARYAATGIWSRAPEGPPDPAALIEVEDLYLTGIDPVSTATDAIALPDPAGFGTDLAMAALSSPAAAGTNFALDARGLVTPSEAGTLSPEGVLVYLGRPAVTPPATPTRFESTPPEVAPGNGLAEVRPRTRPESLIESYERGQFDGLTRTELAAFRPALRPPSLQELASAPVNTDAAVEAALASPFADATDQAATASLRPDTRPGNFARIVQRAQRATPAPQVQVASTATIAPKVVQPRIPSKASVARTATVKNGINLRQVSLIGVYGKPSSRRALVRLPNGRYQKVVVGDRLDGGRVSAIGESELRYRKGSRDMVLKMPRG